MSFLIEIVLGSLFHSRLGRWILSGAAVAILVVYDVFDTAIGWVALGGIALFLTFSEWLEPEDRND